MFWSPGGWGMWLLALKVGPRPCSTSEGQRIGCSVQRREEQGASLAHQAGGSPFGTQTEASCLDYKVRDPRLRPVQWLNTESRPPPAGGVPTVLGRNTCLNSPAPHSQNSVQLTSNFSFSEVTKSLFSVRQTQNRTLDPRREEGRQTPVLLS